MYTFGPLIAKNARSGRLLGGAPITVTTLDGVTLDTYTVDGQPLTLVTNHEGYGSMFAVDTDDVAVLARPRGGEPVPLYAHGAIGQAVRDVATRLSEDALTSTFVTQDDLRVRDSGRRNITPATATAGLMWLRRVGPIVTLAAFNLVLPAPTGSWLHLPGLMQVGFRPGVDAEAISSRRSGVDIGYSVRVLSGGDVYIYGYDGAAIRLSMSWDTTNSWPSTLPGTPA